ncbi:MAG: hypothetical protein RJB01_58 [Actinomycetota bacterium]|jgi:RecB family exonuclease
MGAWLNCPRSYYFRYIAKPRITKTTWAHFSLGNSIHAALKKWWELPLEQRTEATAQELVKTSWQSGGYRDAEQSQRWLSLAQAMVASYVADLDPRREPLSQERTMAFRTEHTIMEGRIDRLDDRGDEIVVVDYKTGKSVPDADTARSSEALAMYALMVQRSLRLPCTRVELHHLPSGQIASWTHSQASLDSHLHRVESISMDVRRARDTLEQLDDPDDSVLANLFPPSPSALCGYCEYRALCPDAQGDRKEPWAALQEEPTSSPD